MGVAKHKVPPDLGMEPGTPGRKLNALTATLGLQDWIHFLEIGE